MKGDFPFFAVPDPNDCTLSVAELDKKDLLAHDFFKSQRGRDSFSPSNNYVIANTDTNKTLCLQTQK